MTTHNRLTPKTLAAVARRLSGDIDGARWALAELAAQAKAEGVAGWAAIIGAECRRQPHTVECWARTWEWCEYYFVDWPNQQEWLPYSFFETAERYSETLGFRIVIEMMETYAGGGTLESFRAQLATLAGKEPDDPESDFRLFATQERNRVLGWIDRAPGGLKGRASACLRLAADALADALTEE